jgi:hypothetical protein
MRHLVFIRLQVGDNLKFVSKHPFAMYPCSNAVYSIENLNPIPACSSLSVLAAGIIITQVEGDSGKAGNCRWERWVETQS